MSAARSASVRVVTTIRAIARSRSGLAGLVMVSVVIAGALLAPLIAPYPPGAQHADNVLSTPGGHFLLGSDEYGRDLLSRILFGARISIAIGFLAVAMGACAGTLLGLAAGYFGGLTETMIMRTTDVVLAFPGLVMGVFVIVILGSGTFRIAVALGIVSLPQFIRLIRAEVLKERGADYVKAAEAIGASDARVLFRHLLPNVAAPALVQVTVALAYAILLEAALSFLGLGIRPPTPSWGGMLNESRGFLQDAPWYGFFPGLALALLLIGLNFLADALQRVLQPDAGQRTGV